MNIKLWDRKTPINGIDAEEILKDNIFNNEPNILLFYENEGKILRIESTEILRNNANLDSTLTPLEVGTKYIDNTVDRIESINEYILNSKSKVSLDDIENLILERETISIKEAVN